ncbi:spermatogenesis-defective protein 39 homolog isoform X2 [Anneissia japonica]|uniref:spermatogenesis-defective protein 39 homolog isoform X2 n=1 Tax=Anneissia japonica TaxID=1529436 RepID=UPI001425AA2F|nr:spermatogenesis-defective protein 39 homolog isoform X2 [Anneissia japonica]
MAFNKRHSSKKDTEVIDWTGNTIGDLSTSDSKLATSARGSNTKTKASSGISRPIEISHHSSKAGRNQDAPFMSLPPNPFPLTSIKSNHKKSASLTIDDKVTLSKPFNSATSIEAAVRKDMTLSHTEVSKLYAEVASLKRELQSSKRSRWAAPKVSDTIIRMMMGESYSLEMYKSLPDKLTLLDSAIEYHDGNSITAIVLFLKKTLKNNIFITELRRRPIAVNHYAVYLQSMGDTEALASELQVLGRKEEAAMWKYRLALQEIVPQVRYQSVKKCTDLHFEGYKLLHGETVFLREQCSLMNKQMLIEDEDAKASKEKKPPFGHCQREAKLYFLPLITTLYYCCKYHFNVSQSSKSSPQSLVKEFNMTEKQYVMTAAKACANQHKWEDLETLLTPKKWLAKTKKPTVGFDRIVEILIKAKAPHDKLEKYMLLMEDTDKRLETAKKYKVHAVVIETLKHMRDLRGLQNYQNEVEYGSREHTQLQTLLKNTSIKWKT